MSPNLGINEDSTKLNPIDQLKTFAAKILFDRKLLVLIINKILDF